MVSAKGCAKCLRSLACLGPQLLPAASPTSLSETPTFLQGGVDNTSPQGRGDRALLTHFPKQVLECVQVCGVCTLCYFSLS